jgi:PhzF family phenazine biosynthesis protein
MQFIAREMNLSETAFVVPGKRVFGLRWFTPRQEVDLCGHATLASAHILWETGVVERKETVCFETGSGRLQATRNNDLIEIDLPIAPPLEEVDIPNGLCEALGIRPLRFTQCGIRHIVEVQSEDIVRSLDPDFHQLRKLPLRGVAVTSLASPKADYQVVSRYFAPWVGIDEDPVTGSVHCCLAVYWTPRLGQDHFVAYQASARGGIIHVRLNQKRVFLSGGAVIIAAGRLMHLFCGSEANFETGKQNTGSGPPQ